jgi:hypothetical protein
MEGTLYAALCSSTDVKRSALLLAMNGRPLIAAAPFQKLGIAAQDISRIPQPLLGLTGRFEARHGGTAGTTLLTLFKHSLVAWNWIRFTSW